MSWQDEPVQKGWKRLARCTRQRAFLFPGAFSVPDEQDSSRSEQQERYPLRLQVAFDRIKLQVARYAALRFPQTMPTIFEKEQWYV